jgi:hypothetical protein
MKLLYLHDGVHEIDKIAFDMGFDVVSYHIEHFDYNLYPDNHFDILYVCLSCKISECLDTEDIEYVVDDVLYYYKLKHWIIEYPDRRVHNNICFWGVPFVEVNFLNWGKMKTMRIYNNVFKWKPDKDYIYITHKQIVKEIFETILIKK